MTVLLGGSRDAHAQVVTDLGGRVIDATTNAPVSDVIVRLPALRRYTLTDSTGAFRLRDVPPGTQTLQLVHLAYGERTIRVTVRPDSIYVIRIEPQPLRMDEIVAADWRGVIRTMNGAAQGQALRMSGTTGDPVFWRSWNREQIVASGHTDAHAFLRRGPPRVSIRKCTGLAFAGIDQLCVGVPFDGMYTSGRAAFGSTIVRGTANSAALVVLIDDRPVRLEDLAQHDMATIHRVEIFGYGGERGIRMYTAGYLHLVATGLIVPHAGAVADAFEFDRADPDTLPGRIRRHEDH